MISEFLRNRVLRDSKAQMATSSVPSRPGAGTASPHTSISRLPLVRFGSGKCLLLFSLVVMTLLTMHIGGKSLSEMDTVSNTVGIYS